MPSSWKVLILAFVVFLGCPLHPLQQVSPHQSTIRGYTVPVATAFAADMEQDPTLGSHDDGGNKPGTSGLASQASLMEQIFGGSALGAVLFGYPFEGLGLADLFILAALAFALARFFVAQRTGGDARQEEDGETSTRLKWPGADNAGKPRDGSEPFSLGGQDASDMNAHGREERKSSSTDELRTNRRLPTVQENAANAWAYLRGKPEDEALAKGQNHLGTLSGMEGNLPPDFDPDDFLDGARALFKRLQDAWTSRRVEDIADFVTAPMMHLIREQAGQGPASGKADILFINATLERFSRDAGKDTAEVRFIVTMRESEAGSDLGDPIEVREIWRIVRSPESNNRWQLDHISQA